jgi:hypothetical protein
MDKPLERKKMFLTYLLKLSGPTDATKKLIKSVQQEIAEMSKEKEKEFKEVNDED